MGSYPISLENVKPCQNNFPLTPGKDKAAMKEKNEHYGLDVYADYADPRLAGLKKRLFRLIGRESEVHAPNCPARGYAPMNPANMELYAAELSRAVGSLENGLTDLHGDNLIVLHKRLNGSKIAVQKGEAGCKKLIEILESEAKFLKKAETIKAARAEKRKKLAESRASSLPFLATAFFCAVKSQKRGEAQQNLGFNPHECGKIPHFCGGIVSKMGVLIIFGLDLRLTLSSSSVSYTPYVDHGYPAGDDKVNASLFMQDEASREGKKNPEVAQNAAHIPPAPDAPHPASVDATPAPPAPVAQDDPIPPAPLAPGPADVPSPVYEAMVKVCIEDFCSPNTRAGHKNIAIIQPDDLRAALDTEFEGAYAETREKVLALARKRYDTEIAEKTPIEKHWKYFKSILVNAIKDAKTAHAEAPRVYFAPEKPAPALSGADRAAVNEAMAAMNEEEHEELEGATKALLLPSQRGGKWVKQYMKNLQAERMGFQVDQGWKVTDEQRQAENLEPSLSHSAPAPLPAPPRPARPGRPVRVVEAGGEDVYDALSTEEKSAWLSKAETALNAAGFGVGTARAIEVHARSLYLRQT